MPSNSSLAIASSSYPALRSRQFWDDRVRAEATSIEWVVTDRVHPALSTILLSHYSCDLSTPVAVDGKQAKVSY